MAKQSGIHQIRGKVGEMSYYRQSGVASGLIRSINQGMSSRVKTAEEFVNTRLNNKEFKNANQIATFAYRLVPRKLVTTMRRFAIAKMTKAVLPYIKAGSGDWGARLPLETLDVIIADALENQAKTGVYDGSFGDYSASIDVATGKVIVNYSISQEVLTTLRNKGISSFLIDYSFAIAAEHQVTDLDGTNVAELLTGLASSELRAQYETTHIPVEGTDEFTPSAAKFHISNLQYTEMLSLNSQGLFVVLSFFPLRDIDQNYYPLYEDGTFLVLPVGHYSAD